MKKIGIMTFHRSYNCGSIMQAYALQKAISDNFNLYPEFIDFSNKGQQDLYAMFDRRLRLRSIIKNIIRAFFYNRLWKNNQSYKKYISSYLNLSDEHYSEVTELNENKLDYDVYLAGSDQVWNITISDSDDAYFLPFVKYHPKIGYALSQGARNIIDYTNDPEKYKCMIKDFDYLSVREPNGQKWLQDSFNINSEIVLDPTLLLDSNDYINAEEPLNEELNKEEYIFVYATELDKKFEKIIRNVAKSEGLKIVIWQPYTWIKIFGWIKGYILPKEQNPGKYLSLMKNAKYVFTASFHGVVFAAQYRKNFWVLENAGMDITKDDRILSLLLNYKLDNRLLRCTEQAKDITEIVNYKYFESQLLLDRKKSFNFLKKAIK